MLLRLAIGLDGQAWLYREVPLAPVTDARTLEDRDIAAAPINGLVSELASQTGTLLKRRSIHKKGYREIHLLSTVASGTWAAPPQHPNAAVLDGYFSTMPLLRRNLLLGIRLRTSMRRSTLRQAVDDFTESMIQNYEIGRASCRERV